MYTYEIKTLFTFKYVAKAKIGSVFVVFVNV